MNQAIRRKYIQYLLTLGLAVYLADKWASGKLSYYINARFFPLTLFAVIALSMMAVAGWVQLVDENTEKANKSAAFVQALGFTLTPVLVTLLLPKTILVVAVYVLAGLLGWLLFLRHTHPTQGEASPKHTHEALPASALLILSLPLLIGLVAPEQPLSSASLSSRGISLNAPVTISQQTNQGLDVQEDDRTILDWVKLFNYESDPSVYIGQDVNVTGFVYHDPRLPQGKFMVSRFIITCCVADAFAIGMPVDWPQDSNFNENTWIQVQGTLDVMQIGSQSVPMVHAASIETIPAPEQPYLYP
ncbi:MAG: putative rane protein [Chloroflexota bacterium]|nr:putative rane protein [Chloroflexota bacterium]